MKLLKKIDGFFLKNSEGNFLTCMALNTQIIGDAEYYFNSQSDISIENIEIFSEKDINTLKKADQKFFDENSNTEYSIHDLIPVKASVTIEIDDKTTRVENDFNTIIEMLEKSLTPDEQEKIEYTQEQPKKNAEWYKSQLNIPENITWKKGSYILNEKINTYYIISDDGNYVGKCLHHNSQSMMVFVPESIQILKFHFK